MQQTFSKTLKAEFIKIKRSAILTLGLIFGAFIPTIFLIVTLIEGTYGTTPVAKGTNFYESIFNMLLEGFGVFFFPLLIIITASKIAQLDHKNKGWQLMETQPVTKFSIFFSKFFILVYNVVRTIVVFTVLTLFAGWIFTHFIDIHENYDLSIPLKEVSYTLLRIFIASLAIIAFQYVVAVLLANFIWSLIIGFGMLLGQLFLSEFDFNMRWFPYNALQVSSANPQGGQLGHFLLKAEWLSLVYTILFLFIGFNWYRFKGFINAFFKKPARVITTLAVIVVTGLLSYSFIKTEVLEPFSKTIIKGTVEADRTIKNVYLIDTITQDTLVAIPMVNNAFRTVYKKPLAPNKYTLQFDNYSQHSVFMSTNDSVQIGYTLSGSNANATISGTRITENMQEYTRGDWSYVAFNLEQNKDLDKPDYYMEEINDEYQESLSTLESKISVDHIVARADFLEISQQLIAVKYAQLWQEYLNKKELYHPNIQVNITPDLKSLLANIDKNNEALLSDNNYVKYITTQLTNKKDADTTLTTLERIKRLKPSSFKNKWLYQNLTQALQEETKNSKRDSLYNLYKNAFSEPRYATILGFQKVQLNKLNAGQPAIDFNAIDKNGKKYALSDFKDSYVMLDTWASWCGPCKYQEPFYIKKYEKYKKENIVFISINVDERENKWREDLVAMNQNILQLRAENISNYMASYGITSIPRFMLIDPAGNIVNAAFTFPSERNFDELLDVKLELKK